MRVHALQTYRVCFHCGKTYSEPMQFNKDVMNDVKHIAIMLRAHFSRIYIRVSNEPFAIVL